MDRDDTKLIALTLTIIGGVLIILATLIILINWRVYWWNYNRCIDAGHTPEVCYQLQKAPHIFDEREVSNE